MGKYRLSACMLCFSFLGKCNVEEREGAECVGRCVCGCVLEAQPLR